MRDSVLHLPLVDVETDNMWYVKVSDAEKNNQIGEFYFAITPEKPDFYFPLYLDDKYNGQWIELSCTDKDVPENLFDGIISGGTIEQHAELYPDMYREEERQQVHFSSRRGWINDPNGLVYVNGEFHMSYQHNPYCPNHNFANVSWGLATSRDGVHFTEFPDIIRPRDAMITVASGSAIIDEDNISGQGKGTILAVYTALGAQMRKGRKSISARGQMMEFSTDGGYTFYPSEHNPIIPIPEGESWRDPKILRMDDGRLCIAVYETYEGQDVVSFYSSSDCINWKHESRAMDLFECPDLFRMKVQETGEELWVLYGVRGIYRVGVFENFHFTQIGESGNLDYGTNTWAGQTWNSHPDNSEGRYHIAWLTNPAQNWCYHAETNHKTPFAQSLTVMTRLTLHKTKYGYRVFRKPIAAFSDLRDGNPITDSLTLCSDEAAPSNATVSLPLNTPGDATLTIDAKLPVSITVNGVGFEYSPGENILRFSGGNTYLPEKHDDLQVRIISDTNSIEFFINDEISATYTCAERDKSLRIESSDAYVYCQRWSLRSIW